jgi:peptide/nickel transport system permease protein
MTLIVAAGLIVVSFALDPFSGPAIVRKLTVSVAVAVIVIEAATLLRAIPAAVCPPNAAKAFRRAPFSAAFGLLMILIYLFAAAFAPLVAPFGQTELLTAAFTPPNTDMLLGGDQLGRDMFSRILFGARNTVGLALIINVIAFTVGVMAGLLAASKGGWIEQLFGRAADVVMSFPSLILALLVLSTLGPKIYAIVIVIVVIFIPRVFRLARAVAANVAVMDYIEVARLRGEGDWYLIRKEILPNSMAPLAAEFGMLFNTVFLLISALSYLGLGIQPPLADWGLMVRENAILITFGEIVPLIPAAAIALLVISVNLVVDWLLFHSSGLKEY